ncbi:Glucose-6-phosphate isomerase [Stieleria neptunia]|uniref:Glucose-6-phosphate isomerase n=1 Tax=Stieleria neptunia TaxID=2527979 RepID=A0A518HS45_9BACT|nr:hypothetical protein [Stieleria neptunia]QDV43670.1 Glucose-6-phosphate isomerase [Stieleria neptunia]
MPLIRLECSEKTFAPGFSESLETVRDQFVLGDAVDFDMDANRCPRLPTDLSFFALPEQQLLAYEKHREISELGHIFRIANGLHDFIDAVVMTGSGAGCVGAQAIATACCDPYHNELSRAARGSKPRIYFADDSMDNDQIQSLLGRLTAGGYGDGAADALWAIIAADRATPADRPPLVLDHLVETLRSTTAADADFGGRLITAIGSTGAAIPEPLAALGLDQSLRVPDAIDDRYSVLTPIGLLSSAFLGLDCIQLLVGAAAMNENFRNEPFEQNIVLRYAAMCRGRQRLFAWWPRRLCGLDRWLESLTSDHCRLDLAADSDREEFAARLDSGSPRCEELVCNHVQVDAIRTDPLPVTPNREPQGDQARESVAERQAETAATVSQQLTDRGIRQNTITLPVIDTHSLGQLLQMLMLAAAIESEGAAGRFGSGV